MLGHRDLTMEDYLGIWKRRWWLILICAVVLLAIGAGVSYVIPPQFVSTTLVLIEQQKVPENYVKPVIDEDLGERLASMREQILSRSRIQPIIEKFNLFAGHGNTMDDRDLDDVGYMLDLNVTSLGTEKRRMGWDPLATPSGGPPRPANTSGTRGADDIGSVPPDGSMP